MSSKMVPGSVKVLMDAGSSVEVTHLRALVEAAEAAGNERVHFRAASWNGVENDWDYKLTTE